MSKQQTEDVARLADGDKMFVSPNSWCKPPVYARCVRSACSFHITKFVTSRPSNSGLTRPDGFEEPWPPIT